jgi:CheY-like chemotaxis protein
LVVEDSASLGRLLTTTLGGAGHRAVWAASGAEAVAEAATLAPDVALIDLHLGDMTGPDLAAVLRRDHPDTRLVAVSGETPTADVRALFDAFLLKPVALETLLRTIGD